MYVYIYVYIYIYVDYTEKIQTIPEPSGTPVGFCKVLTSLFTETAWPFCTSRVVPWSSDPAVANLDQITGAWF